jgi:hypothetical protein
VLTYVGNAPNFMIKAIAEVRGAAMPGFFSPCRVDSGHPAAVFRAAELALPFAVLPKP